MYKYAASLHRSCENELLLWEAIQYAKDAGFTYFDMSWMTLTDDKDSDAYRLYQFKRKFGGELVDFYTYVKFRGILRCRHTVRFCAEALLRQRHQQVLPLSEEIESLQITEAGASVAFNLLDVNKINCRYFSRGAQLELFKESYLDLLPPEKLLFPRFIGQGDAVLDLGCGAGRTTAHIHKMTDRVIGTDLSEVMIEVARQKHPGIEFRVMDASQLDYPDDSFDVVVFSYNGLCYLYPEEKRLSSIKEIHRVLEKGGKFIFSSFNRYPPRTLSSIVNIIITKILMGFSAKYKIHLTRYGVTINYETTPDEEISLFRTMSFELEEQIPMPERVGFLNYRPDVATYYVFSKI